MTFSGGLASRKTGGANVKAAPSGEEVRNPAFGNFPKSNGLILASAFCKVAMYLETFESGSVALAVPLAYLFRLTYRRR